VAFGHGVTSNFQIADSGAVNRDLSAYLDKVDGLPGAAAVNETTTFGVAGLAKTYVRGLNDAPFSIAGFFDPTVTSGPDVVLSGLRTASTPAAFSWSPLGTATGAVKYTGNAYLTDYKISAPVANVVSFTASFQTSGILTRGAN
jgi:hypothetical protein